MKNQNVKNALYKSISLFLVLIFCMTSCMLEKQDKLISSDVSGVWDVVLIIENGEALDLGNYIKYECHFEAYDQETKEGKLVLIIEEKPEFFMNIGEYKLKGQYSLTGNKLEVNFPEQVVDNNRGVEFQPEAIKFHAIMDSDSSPAILSMQTKEEGIFISLKKR